MAGPGGTQAGRLAVRVLPDTTVFARSLQRYLDRIEARTVLNLRTDVDGDGLIEQVREMVRVAQTTTVDLLVQTDTDDLVSETRRAALVAEHSTRIDLPVHLDVRALGSKLAMLGASLAAGGRIAVTGMALAGAAVQATNLVAALAPAAGALAAIPALALGAAAAVAVLRLAFKGVGDAIAGDPEALARLAPAARSVVGEIRRVQPALDALRRTVQQSVFAPLVGEVRALSNTWVPLLSARLSGIGKEFGRLFAALAQGARSSVFLQGVDAALRATQAGVAALSGVAGPVLQALGAVIGAFVPALSGAGAGLARLATEFSAFVLYTQQSGQLAGFVTQVGTTLRQIGGVLLQLGAIVAAVFSAAQTSGAGFAGNLRQVLTSVNAFLSAGEGRSALQAFFASASTVLRSLLPVVTTLAGGIGSVLAPALATVATALAPVVNLVAGALVQGVAALAPALGPFASALAGIVAAAAPLLPVVGQVAAVLAGMLTSALTALTPLIDRLVSAITGAGLDQAFAEIGAALAPLLGALMAVLMPLVEAILPLLAPLVEAIGAVLGLIVVILRPTMAILAVLAQRLAGELTPVVGLFALGLTWLVNNALRPASEWFGHLAKVITSVDWAAVWAIVATGISWVIGWFGALPNRAAAALVGFAGQIRGALFGAVEQAKDIGRNIVQGVIDGIQGMLNRAIETARNMGRALANAAKNALGISSPSTLFATIGRDTVAGFVLGIERAQPAATSAMVAMVAAPDVRQFTLATAGVSGPADLREPTVNLTALVRVGDGPVIDAVETAVSRNPETFARHVRTGERGLTRRG